MKKRIIASLAILAVLGLAIAAYAYNQTKNTTGNTASCCKNSDSCPMKASMLPETAGEHTGKSCPMKSKTASTTVAADHNCCDCCGDSCPMKKDGEVKATATSTTENGTDCCDACDCCNGKEETAA
ncbi:MAG: hypothetical protein ABIU09_10430 [Pyrinomonadaceae bacterium]